MKQIGSHRARRSLGTGEAAPSPLPERGASRCCLPPPHQAEKVLQRPPCCGLGDSWGSQGCCCCSGTAGSPGLGPLRCLVRAWWGTPQQGAYLSVSASGQPQGAGCWWHACPPSPGPGPADRAGGACYHLSGWRPCCSSAATWPSWSSFRRSSSSSRFSPVAADRAMALEPRRACSSGRRARA